MSAPDATTLKRTRPPLGDRLEQLEQTVSELQEAISRLLALALQQALVEPGPPLVSQRSLLEWMLEHSSVLRRDDAASAKATEQMARVLCLIDSAPPDESIPVSGPRLESMERPTDSGAGPAYGGVAGAKARGEAARLEWVDSGEVISAKELARAWGLTTQALGPAAERGEVFALLIKNRRYYPREFLELHRDDVSTVSQALGSLSPAKKLVFWKRKHGALGGKTVLQALESGVGLNSVTRLAEAWAAEEDARTHADTAA